MSLFSELRDLLAAASNNTLQLPEEELLPVVRHKRKKRKSRRKKATSGNASGMDRHSRNPSPHPHADDPNPGHFPARHAANPEAGAASSSSYTQQLPPFLVTASCDTPPTAVSAARQRPQSARPAAVYYTSADRHDLIKPQRVWSAVGTRKQGTSSTNTAQFCLPASFSSRTPTAAGSSGSPYGPVRAPTAPPGPAAKAAAALSETPWRAPSPPKYTAASLKQPELGTVPGKHYQSPLWQPVSAADSDPNRQEMEHLVKEQRFKHVLAVPAHVLAKSLFHPDHPSEKARARQLADELKTARMDRRLALTEKCSTEKELRSTQDQLTGAQQHVAALSKQNKDLREQLKELATAYKQLAAQHAKLLQHLDAAGRLM